MSQPPFKASQRRLLIGSAIALALFANPFSYDFTHNEWQMNQAYAKSCFIAGTRITMADGSIRPIETLQAGEQVLDQHGGSNRILAVEQVILGKRRLYGINHLAPFFTAEHPLLTTRGWAAISPAMTRTEKPAADGATAIYRHADSVSPGTWHGDGQSGPATPTLSYCWLNLSAGSRRPQPLRSSICCSMAATAISPMS